jgi:hypothetical protein
MHCCTVDCAVVSAHEHFASVRLQVDGVFVRQANYRACESTRYAQFLAIFTAQGDRASSTCNTLESWATVYDKEAKNSTAMVNEDFMLQW